ncbi:MAG TPA: TIGR02391 family protein [Methanofastidiosum sp.]|nr:TIGR02391 family protein [Methanofastidiosum sp.]
MLNYLVRISAVSRELARYDVSKLEEITGYRDQDGSYFISFKETHFSYLKFILDTKNLKDTEIEDMISRYSKIDEDSVRDAIGIIESSNIGKYKPPGKKESLLEIENRIFKSRNIFLKSKKDYLISAFNIFKEEFPNKIESKVGNSTDLDLWQIINPKIKDVSKNRFDDGHYADSVEAAFKEINSTVKKIVKTNKNQERDGKDLMFFAFSKDNPVITLKDPFNDLSDVDLLNIQEGFSYILAGSMQAIRNPKAHSNIEISKERAIHFIFLASLLMEKIEEALK